MATFARAQFLASTDGIDPATRAITPTAASSLLVAECNERSGGTEANHVVTDSLGNTWTKQVGHNQAFGDPNARQSVSLWTCLAGNTTARTVSFDDGTANGKRLSVSEYTTDSTGTWGFEAEVSADSGTGSTSPIATGSTSSVAAGDLLVIAWAAWRTNAPQAYDVAFSTGYSTVGDTGAGTNGRQHATAWKKDTAGGTFSASVAWTGSGHEGAAGVLVMKLAPAGPGPDPVASGPLTKTNDTYTGYRIGGFSATDDVAVTKWRHRIEGGSWVEHGVVTYIDITGRTHGDTETVDVQAGDADGHWSNTLTIEAHVGWRDVSAHALHFAGNGLGNSNSRLNLAGDYRTAFSAIWKSKRESQTNYYSECWLTQDLGPDSFDGGKYSIGFHPYPADGTFDANGQRLAYDANNHYFEIAGVWQGEGVSQDRIASPVSIVGSGNQVAFPVDKSDTAWYTNYVAIELIASGTVARAYYYPDLEGDATKVMMADMAVADIQSPTNPVWQFGSPNWMPSGNTSNETPKGKSRYFKLFHNKLSLPDALAEAQSESDLPVSAGGIASVLFSNINPTVTDVTDKSGEGNDLSWGTTARPTNYSESVEVEVLDVDPVELAAAGAAQASASAALGVAKALGATGAAQALGTAALLKGARLAAAGIANASGSASISHSVPLQASAAAVATAGAQLALAVSLSGAGLAQAAASAGIALGKPLAAGGAAQASGGASLSTTGDVELAAAGAARASASAVLSLSVSLSGAAVAQALGAAVLGVGKQLAAAGAAQASGGAALQVGNATDLAAAAVAGATGGAALHLEVPLSAAALADAVASSSLLLTVPLSAAAFASASSSAQFARDVQMSAQGVALATATASLMVTGPYARAPEGFGYLRFLKSSRPARIQTSGRPSTAMTRPRR